MRQPVNKKNYSYSHIYSKTMKATPSQESESIVHSSFCTSFKQAEDHTWKILCWAAVAAKTTAICWILLVAIVFVISGPMVDTNPRYWRLSPTASAAAQTAACVQLSGMLLRIVHHCNMDSSCWISKFGNGGFNTVIVILSISAATNLLLANFPTPVFCEDISGTATYPLLWAEWVIISGSFTFMIESLDAQHWRAPALMALRQSIVPFGGLICIFLPQFTGKILLQGVVEWYLWCEQLDILWKTSARVLCCVSCYQWVTDIACNRR